MRSCHTKIPRLYIFFTHTRRQHELFKATYNGQTQHQKARFLSSHALGFLSVVVGCQKVCNTIVHCTAVSVFISWTFLQLVGQAVRPPALFPFPDAFALFPLRGYWLHDCLYRVCQQNLTLYKNTCWKKPTFGKWYSLFILQWQLSLYVKNKHFKLIIYVF